MVSQNSAAFYECVPDRVSRRRVRRASGARWTPCAELLPDNAERMLRRAHRLRLFLKGGNMKLHACSLLGLLAVGASAQSPSQQPDVADLREALAGCRSSFTSVQSDVVVTATHTDDYYRVFTAFPIPKMRERRGRFVADRHTYRLDLAAESAAVPEYGLPAETNFWDGQRRLTVESSPISDGASGSLWTQPGAATPLDYGYTHKGIWYADLLAQPGFRVTGMVTTDGAGPLLRVEGPGELGKRLRVLFRPDWGYLAVRAELRHEPPIEDTGCETWIVDEARLVNGLWLPVQASRRWSVVKQGREVLLSEISMRMTSPKVGDDCAELLQPPTLPPGALVVDRDNKVIYEVREDGSLDYAGQMNKRSGQTSAMPHSWVWLGLTIIGLATVSGAVMRRKGAR